LDLAALRADTPGCLSLIHLNNAGASLMPRPVIRDVLGHFERETEIGGYEAETEARERIEEARTALGGLLGTTADRIAFMPHATSAFSTALSSVKFDRGDVIATTRADYVSNQIAYLSLQHRYGVEIVRAADAPEGGVDLHSMEEIIHRRRPKVVAVTHAPSNSGLIQDVASVGTMCASRGILYLVDGCQSVGQMPVDAEQIGCDFLSGTARKYMRGPRGVGFLYVSERALDSGLEPLFLDMRGADWIDDDLYQPMPDARRFESWEFAWGLVLGMGAAARYATEIGLAPIRDRARALATSLREGLAEVGGVTVLDRGPELGATVTVSAAGRQTADLVRSLRERGINTTAQTATDAVIDYGNKGVDGALRISPHYYNLESEISDMIEALSDILRV
jgi:selenocysteine lyase/cysteine desulfurase